MAKDKDWYKKLPEYKRLTELLDAVDEFNKKHEEVVKCTGCKICLDYRDIDTVLMLEGKPKYPRRNPNCSYKKVIPEHLSKEDLEYRERLYKEMGEANLAYVKVVNPKLYKSWTEKK